MPERCIFTKPDIFHILSLANGSQVATSTLVQLGNLTRPLGSRRQLLLNSGKVQETKIKLLQNREEEINPKFHKFLPVSEIPEIGISSFSENQVNNQDITKQQKARLSDERCWKLSGFKFGALAIDAAIAQSQSSKVAANGKTIASLKGASQPLMEMSNNFLNFHQMDHWSKWWVEWASDHGWYQCSGAGRVKERLPLRTLAKKTSGPWVKPISRKTWSSIYCLDVPTEHFHIGVWARWVGVNLCW